MFAVAVGVLLEFLLESLAHPLAAFGLDLEFDVAQGARLCLVRVHGPFTGVCLFDSGGEPFTPP